MNNILTFEQYQYQQKQQDSRFQLYWQCQNQQEIKQQHKILYQEYRQQVELNWKRKYTELKGWGIVEPIIDLKAIAPLCKYPYRNHFKGCSFCKSKRYWNEIIDPEQPVWALYFSMDLTPLWSKLKKKFPYWTDPQVENHRYWRATKHKLVRKIEQEFLKFHPGPWCRALNRANGYQDLKTGDWIHCPHTTYTFGIHYNHTMEQIGVYLQWPPEPHPITIQFLGRPKPGVDLSRDNFILSEETIKKSIKRPVKNQNKMTDQEYVDLANMAINLKLEDITQ